MTSSKMQAMMRGTSPLVQQRHCSKPSGCQRGKHSGKNHLRLQQPLLLRPCPHCHHNETTKMSLHVTYMTPKKPGSFGSAHYLGEHFGRRKADQYLRSQEAYILQKQVQKRFPRHKTLSKGITDLYQVDLVDLMGIASYNDSYCYMLTCINVFSNEPG